MFSLIFLVRCVVLGGVRKVFVSFRLVSERFVVIIVEEILVKME